MSNSKNTHKVSNQPGTIRSKIKSRFTPNKDVVHAAHSPRPQPHRGIYLLPNSFTLAALFSGFYAIVQAMNQQFEVAAIAIFAA